MADPKPKPKYRINLIEKYGVAYYVWGSIEGHEGEWPYLMIPALQGIAKAVKSDNPTWTMDDIIAAFQAAGYVIYPPGGIVKKLHTEYVPGSAPAGSADTILIGT